MKLSFTLFALRINIVRRVRPDIPVVFNNTKVEIPETYQLKRQLVKDWNLDLVEVFPLNNWSFWKVIEKYGFPLGQRFGNKATSCALDSPNIQLETALMSTRHTNGKCCYYLKKAPMLVLCVGLVNALIVNAV